MRNGRRRRKRRSRRRSNIYRSLSTSPTDTITAVPEENIGVKKVFWEACFPPERSIPTADITLRHTSAGEVMGPF
ncbi:MAG: hypothetical protein WC364_00315 [Eubacteriales bacterium]